MSELILKINQIVKKFNETFEISPITQNNEETDGIEIKSLKNNGIEFNDEFFNFFNDIIKNIDDNYELIYNPEKGLVVVKRTVEVKYDEIE